ncbi:MAG: Nif3-like dinuclear metal center hexameric protein [Bacteroidales bacterium]|nr:Nif3-like dinuclear metal center hexameric protein [Bacteroidales bacterium]
MQLKAIIRALEHIAPLAQQEEYDNSGLIYGDKETEISSALLALDVSEEVIDEAIRNGHNLIISHHPLIFEEFKQLTPNNRQGSLLIKAIKHDIALFAFHTCFDNIPHGVNYAIGKLLGIERKKILLPQTGRLKKIVVFCPDAEAMSVREAMFDAGAGVIGNYDHCSFNLTGKGTFKALEGTNPYVGKQNELHTEHEARIEMIMPGYITKKVIAAMLKVHPYEEVAYDLYPLDNEDLYHGAGMIGTLPSPMKEDAFFSMIKELFHLPVVRHSGFIEKPLSTVAWCGGAGAFLIATAKRAKADVFLTGDIKHHQFQESEKQMIIADIGHFESEIHSITLLKDEILKKIPNFACSISAKSKNAVHYF